MNKTNNLTLLGNRQRVLQAIGKRGFKRQKMFLLSLRCSPEVAYCWCANVEIKSFFTGKKAQLLPVQSIRNRVFAKNPVSGARRGWCFVRYFLLLGEGSLHPTYHY
ncbi:MAG: hypothetical protein SXA11_06995 [Cyanobacteriota bacterium]|nr:hypothetical protein [Cyanobacteriota bacterium]